MSIFFIKGMEICRCRRPKKKDLYVSTSDFKHGNKYFLRLKRFMDSMNKNKPDKLDKK